MSRRSAFTLFEIALALALVAIGVVSVLVMLPQGLRAQQNSRFKIFASAKALEMVGAFSSFSDTSASEDETRTMMPWDVPLTYRSRSPDYENKVVASRFGVQPVPMTIARRLDSDNDEIARLLDEGAQLYYARPRANLGMKEEAQELFPQAPNEMRRLVFAVMGAAQQNAVIKPSFSPWPAHSSYPSPPSYFGDDEHSVLWEDTKANDPEVAVPFMLNDLSTTPPLSSTAGWLWLSGEDSYSDDPVVNPPVRRGRQAALDYVALAVWYARRRFAEAADATLGNAFIDATSMPTPEKVAAAASDRRAAGMVRAMRILSHATTALTAHVTMAELDAGTVIFPALTVNSFPGAQPGLTLSHRAILIHHEAMLALVMRFCASDPYDWGANRPINRTIMMDVPLLQYDLFAPAMTGTIARADDVPAAKRTAEQWTIIAANRLLNIPGTWQRNYHYNTGVLHPSTSQFGTPEHFNLTAPFGAEERCRELVFWDVDWQGYSDAETAPSAPLDSSEYPFSPPRYPGDQGVGFRMGEGSFNDMTAPAYRNPEKPLVFLVDMSDRATGIDVGRLVGLGDDMTVEGGVMGEGGSPLEDMGNGPKPLDRVDGVPTVDTRYIFNGLYGADRNANQRLDRGEVPAATRMRARSVARFVLYDPRVQVTLR